MQSRYFCVESFVEGAERARLAQLMDAAAVDIAELLDIPLSPRKMATVTVGAASSQVSGSDIRIQAKPPLGRYSSLDWFELLFRHELTHLLVRRHWGTAPALFWEGLPIHLGDELVRKRLFGHSYRAHCAALFACGPLIALSRLILPSDYYGMRTDFRVDLQAGAFTAFVLERNTIQDLRSLFRTYRQPSPQRPWVAIDRLCQKTLGADLVELECLWQRWLEGIPVDTDLVRSYHEIRFTDRAVVRTRCDFCMHRLDPSGKKCTSCGQLPVPVELRRARS